MADTRIDELRRRLERDPGSRLFAQLAEELRKSGELVEAIRVARAGLAVHSSYPSARLTLGRALLDSGDATSARAELESVLRDAPDNILASRFLAQAREALGDLKGALEQYQRTLQMAPGDQQVQVHLSAVEARLNEGPATGVGGRTRPPEPRPAPAPQPAVETLQIVPPRPTVPEPPAAAAVELPPTVRIRPEPATATAPASSAAAAPPAAPPAVPAPAPAAPPNEPSAAPLSAAETARLPLNDVELTGGGATGEHHTWFAPPEPRAARAPEPEAPPQPPAKPPVQPAAALIDPDHSTPFSSSTLAELYYQQGLVDRAVDVYRQLLQQEPSNERARLRLVELESPGAPAPEPSAVDERTARRRALERTIAGLETLLAAVQRKGA